MMKVTIDTPLSLLQALEKLSPASSKTTLRSWLKEGRVFVDEVEAKDGKTVLNPGQTVSLGAKKTYAEGGINVLYKDESIVIIDKPSGLLSVATVFQKEKTAHCILKEMCRPQKVYVVHRLDQDTSGVMVFALTENAYEKLKVLFEKHDIQREYTAIVEGTMVKPSGKWESYLHEDQVYFVHSSDDPDRGRHAITHYEVIQKTRRYTRLCLTLETGRKNQIRVHCQEAGHSVVGDKKYGATSNPIKRLCLHAHLLAFKHPRTGKLMTFTSPAPQEFNRLCSIETPSG